MSSLDSLNYRNPFAPDLSIGQNLYASFQQGRDAVNSVFEQQRQQQLAQARLDAAQQQLALNAQLAPYQAEEAKQQNLVRQHQINQFGTSDALASENLAQTRRENNWYSTTHPSGGYVNADALPPLPEGAGPVNPSPLMGQTFTSNATGYHPVSSDSPDYKMEGGMLDAQGNKVFTLDAYRRGEVPYVTAAIDKGSPLFGQSAFSPTLNAPIHFTDTGSAFRGKGNSRVDIARDDNAGALSNENNGPVQFNLGNVDSGSASTLTVPNQTSVLDVAATSNAIPALAQSDISQPIAPIGETSIPIGQNGMIPKRISGIRRADGNFVPGADPSLLRPGDQLATRDVLTPSAGLVASDKAALTSAGRNGVPVDDIPTDEYGAMTPAGRTELANRIKTAKAKHPSGSIDGDSAEPLLNDDTIQQLAEQKLLTGKNNFSGMGKQAVAARAAIENRAAEMQKSTGQTGADAVVTFSGVSASQKALAAQQKQLSSIQSFEGTAKDNAQIALGLVDKGGGPTGVPVLNRWLQAGRRSVAGDPDVAAFDTAIGAFKNEYAKIISGSTGSAGASDSSRREAEELINKAGTPEQLKAQIKVAFQEMENRTKNIQHGVDGLSESIRNAGKPKSTQTPPSGKTLSPQEQKLADWATANPDDPRSKAILQKLGL